MVAVTAASAAYAATVGRGTAGTAAVAAAVLAGQLSVGWHNDALDAPRDARAGRRDKPVARGDVTRRAVAVAAALAVTATVPLSLLSGWRAALVHLLAVGSAWAYNARLKSTAASPLPYLVSFGLLPCFVTLGLPGGPLPPWWVPAGTALLGASAHVANVLPDLEDDRRLGVLGLPQRLGPGASLPLMALALLAATGVLGLGSGSSGALGGAAVGAAVLACLGAVVLVRLRPRSRLPFALVVGTALLDVALLVLDGRAPT